MSIGSEEANRGVIEVAWRVYGTQVMTVQFDRIALIGIGLIGSSIAR